MDDNKIIELFFARDETAIKETAYAYGKKLECLSYGILKNIEDAKECINDTYLKAWNTIPPQKPTYFYAFIAKICRHLCFGKLDYKNAQKRNFEVVNLSDELMCCIPDKFSEIELEDKAIGDILTAFLNTLSEDNRLIFMRRYWYCASVSEISKHYHISESKVKTSLHRTRKKLKAYLETEGIFVWTEKIY
ncbi:MAG: sigma-70 family RNA polymerase sigma factor [Clostridia bacterium]|nr:sigma-70 family RNA polymerase sigma factor [Clostridia bacterium]